MTLQKVLSERIPRWRSEVEQLLKKYPTRVISQINIQQLFRGLRNVDSLVCDTSYVSPEKGLYIRGRHLSELLGLSPEALFFLLCTGGLPDAAAEEELRAELIRRCTVPSFIWDLIRSLPQTVPPIAVLSMALTALSGSSEFYRQYSKGLERDERWQVTLLDALNLMGVGPVIAAGIYRIRILKKEPILPESTLNFAENFARMLDLDDPDGHFRRLIRLFVLTHADHEGGSVSINVCRIVNSALADLYLSVAAGFNGLAGPIHGNANQGSVKFVKEIFRTYGRVPSRNELHDFVENYLAKGKILPGFGHAVLRGKDPRFENLLAFGKEVCPDDELFQIMELLNEVVPPILKAQGKVKDPYPNIDAISGIILQRFGLKEMSYYPVMFAVPLMIGMSAQLIVNQAMLYPIFRPRSLTTAQISEKVKKLKL